MSERVTEKRQRVILAGTAVLTFLGVGSLGYSYYDAEQLEKEKAAASRIYRESPPWPQRGKPSDYHPLTNLEDRIINQLQRGDTINIELTYDERVSTLIGFGLRDDARKAQEIEAEVLREQIFKRALNSFLHTVGLGFSIFVPLIGLAAARKYGGG